MQELLLSEIKEQWLKKNWKPGDTFHLFIDNPFCIQKCNFCIYQSSQEKINAENYLRYYQEYLPQMIDDFSDIISMHPVKSIYFGGGTPSLMTLDIMKNIMNQIPNFKQIFCKIFESHPSIITSDKIDYLGEQKFTYITFGIQTLDRKVLQEQNRIPHQEKKLKKYIDQIHSLGMRVNCDLLGLLEKDLKQDMLRLESDLQKLADEFAPDTIDIYPVYQEIESQGKMAEEGIEKVRQMRRTIRKFLRKAPEYSIQNQNCLSLDSNDLKKNYRTNYILKRMSDEEYKRYRVYSSSGYPYQPTYQNVIGLGGFGERRPYSYMGHDFFYYLYNDHWQPRYFQETSN